MAELLTGHSHITGKTGKVNAEDTSCPVIFERRYCWFSTPSLLHRHPLSARTTPALQTMNDESRLQLAYFRTIPNSINMLRHGKTPTCTIIPEYFPPHRDVDFRSFCKGCLLRHSCLQTSPSSQLRRDVMRALGPPAAPSAGLPHQPGCVDVPRLQRQVNRI